MGGFFIYVQATELLFGLRCVALFSVLFFTGLFVLHFNNKF